MDSETHGWWSLSREVPAGSIGDLRKRFGKIVRRAERLGVPPPAMREFDRVVRTVLNEDGQLVPAYFLGVSIEGTMPAIAGWRPVGWIHHMEGVSVALGAGVSLPAGLADDGDVCDHCETRRVRRETFVLRDGAGALKRVGRSCLKDFLGGASVAGLFAAVEARAGAEAVLDDVAVSHACGRSRGVSILAYLTHVARELRSSRFVSKGEAYRSRGVSTSEVAWRAMSRQDHDVRPELRDAICAQEVLDWARDLDPPEGDDYLGNVHAVALCGVVDEALAGLAASLFAAKERQDRARLRAELERRDGASVHFGEVGKRAEFALTCEQIAELDHGTWGERHLVRLRDSAGNAAVWFCSGAAPFEEGWSGRVKATVKEHGEYRGKKQTVLTRIKVL